MKGKFLSRIFLLLVKLEKGLNKRLFSADNNFMHQQQHEDKFNFNLKNTIQIVHLINLLLIGVFDWTGGCFQFTLSLSRRRGKEIMSKKERGKQRQLCNTSNNKTNTIFFYPNPKSIIVATSQPENERNHVHLINLLLLDVDRRRRRRRRRCGHRV